MNTSLGGYEHLHYFNARYVTALRGLFHYNGMFHHPLNTLPARCPVKNLQTDPKCDA